ncbi:MAG: ABC transporter substrate-binding protein [Candidatus Nomurabacteria bacterium]|jgi:peptide/nickel transport system substrate-binding protein|nr:ABC transporter substrate-binding protein [Candidatus Nomurabacteria bacterium]
MKKSIKKSGQKIIKKLSRASHKTAEKSKEHVKKHIFQRVSNIRNVRLWVFEWILLVTVVILFSVIQNIWYRSSYESEVFVSGGGYSEGTLGAINSMNPLYASTNSEKTLSKLMFSSLLAPDTSGHLGNSLAKSVSVDNTGKIWTVTLKDDVKWSDGAALTAEDVIYTINLIKSSAAKTTVATNFTNVKIAAPDDTTVVFTLPTIYAAFTETLDFPIVPKHLLGNIEPGLVYENDFSTNPIGSGPFTLNAMQKNPTGQTLHLSRNPNYFSGAPTLANFTLRTYSKPSEIAAALNRAEINASADLGTLSNKADLNTATIYERKAPLSGGIFAFLNTDSLILSSTKVRQAIQRGVDMAVVRQGTTEDQALDFPILKRQIPDLKFPEMPVHDTAAAIKLLTDAKYQLTEGQLFDPTGARASLTISVLSAGILPEIATRLSEQLAELGFEVTIDEFIAEEASQDFFTAVILPRSYDILIYEIDLGLDADPFAYFDSANATATGMNLSNYRNSIVDDLLLSARTTMNSQLRKAKYESFLKYWLNDAPALGIYQSSLSYYYTKNTRIFSENNVLTHSLDRFADVTYWATEKSTRNRTP